MARIKLIDAFKWGVNKYDVPIERRMRRNFFFYALVRDDPSQIHEIGDNAPDLPEYLARFITSLPVELSHCTFLDRMYFIHSRNKYIISLYEDLFIDIRGRIPSNVDDYIVGNQALYAICPMIYAEKEKKWKEISDTYFYEYDPIENYNMIEQLENDIKEIDHGHTITRTDNLQDQTTYNTTDQETVALQDQTTYNTTDTRTPDLEEDTTYNNTETRTPNITNAADVYGFNSSSAVHANAEHQTGTETLGKTGHDTVETTGTDTNRKTGTETVSRTGTDTDHKTGTETRANTGTQTSAETGTDTETRNYTLTRSGNIGVTTTQQMIQQQRELLLYSFLNDVVFPDIDKALTLSIY